MSGARAALRIGTAGWSLPRVEHARFGGEGTHLQRYATVLNAAEINASFHRPLRVELYAKWAAAVPDDFRFSVKLPRTISHDQRLIDCETLLADFLDQVQGLGDKLGCLLVQLPPSFAFDASRVGAFFEVFRALHEGPIALEPRHPSWFLDAVNQEFCAYQVARVAADPAVVPCAAEPGGDDTIVYHRLHGSPRVYWSRYDDAWLDRLGVQLAHASSRAHSVWCIFDNTAGGAAVPNALDLQQRIT